MARKKNNGNGQVLKRGSSDGRDAEPRVRGLWLTRRKDPRNQARADVAGRMSSAPAEVWSRPTGARVLYAREFDVAGEAAVLVQAGATVQLCRWDGTALWHKATIGAISFPDTPEETSVVEVADFDGDNQLEVLYQSSAREVQLLDLATGEHLWRWEAPVSTFLAGQKTMRVAGGVRFICFPSFITEGWCWDFSGARTKPRLLWHRDCVGRYLPGYGPAVLLADMNCDGRDEVVISSKAEGNIIYQGVLDADTGQVLYDGSYPAEPGSPIISGRPYGLSQAVDLDGDGREDLLTVACLVEEHYAAARNTGHGFERMWGRAVEKDFPEDHRELQPRLSSVARLRAKAGPEVVLGLWEDGRWRTLVLESATGRTRGELEECYFWGCADFNSDGLNEILVSRESQRRPGRPTTLQLLSGDTLFPVAELPSAGLFPSLHTLRSPLPDDTAFLAARRDPLFVSLSSGGVGVLVRTIAMEEPAAMAVWGGPEMQMREIAGPEIVRVDVQERLVLLTDNAGRIHRYDSNLRPTGQSLQVHGRFATPLVYRVGGRTELVFDESGPKVTGGTVDYSREGELQGEWSVKGSTPALHVDCAGQGRMCVADMNDSECLTYGTSVTQVAYRPAVTTHEWPFSSSPGTRIELEHPPYVTLLAHGEGGRILVNMQTGTHTNSLACYNFAGELLWRDEAWGTYPKLPGVGDINGDGEEEVVADDHGYCKLYDASGSLLAEPPGWPPAYTLPIVGPFSVAGMVLRTSGINGLQMLDGSGEVLWTVNPGATNPARSSRHFGCLGSVADLTGEGVSAFGTVAEDGMFECLNLSDGNLRWSLDLGCEPSNSSVVSGDLTGNGCDEFLVGLPDGRLVCLGEEAGEASVWWEVRYSAGIGSAIIADVDGDEVAEIIVATADGHVRVLK